MTNSNNMVPEKNTIYLIPIFKHFNERAAILTLVIKPWSGQIAITMAPSKERGKSSKNGVVPAGKNVYDYTQEAFTFLTYPELIQIRTYMKTRIEPAESMIMNSCAVLMSNFAQQNPQYQEFSNYISGVNQKYQTDREFKEGVSVFRHDDIQKKLWRFNYAIAQDGKEIFYISVVKNNDPNSRIYLALGEAAAIPFYYTIDSYIRNKSTINTIATMFSYLDGETQAIKVASYIDTIKNIFGQDMEKCNDTMTQTNLNNIVNEFGNSVYTSMINSKNMKKSNANIQHNWEQTDTNPEMSY